MTSLELIDSILTLEEGYRMCQFTIEKAIPFKFDVVDSLGNKDRGGYGTSGK